ncbi:hypothetical protein GCM10009802_07830 [Streptomyces synnematoformans]|uniref:Uncharacterized protein n=2 Tax=Streptomyces synnematoformans TaxID=415721 RepID=A0ABN2XEB8_9ACTN
MEFEVVVGLLDQQEHGFGVVAKDAPEGDHRWSSTRPPSTQLDGSYAEDVLIRRADCHGELSQLDVARRDLDEHAKLNTV